MWHEARKQEKKIRSLMVDYRKRADRRRQFYEKIKLDPAQFLRIYGRPMKIHWEQSVALAAESPQSMMPWQGDSSIMIDRFDVRAHLDYIPARVATEESELTNSDEEEERNTNYERYRILVQNECAGVAEEQCLQQIYVDEMYGAQEVKAKERDKQEEKAKLAEKKAAIGFKYEDTENEDKKEDHSEAESEESIDSDMDLDAVFDVDKLTTEQTEALNQVSVIYGMEGDDYINCLWKDKDDAEELRLAKMMEEERAQYSGRKSRRERRAYKEKKLRERGSLSPPSYAKRDSPKYEPYGKPGRSPSRSVSPVVRMKKKFITSFGGSDDEARVLGPELPPHLLNKSEKPKSRKSNSPPMFKEIGPSVAKFKAVSKRHRSSSSSRSPSPRARTHHKKKTRSRSRSYTRSTYRRSHWSDRRQRSRSNSRSRTYSRRSRSPRPRSARSRSKRSRSRSPRSRSHRSRSRSRRSRSRRSRSRRSRSHRSRSDHSDSGSSSSSDRSRSGSRSPEQTTEAPSVFRRRSITPSSSELSLSEDEGGNLTKSTAQQDMGKKEGFTFKSRIKMQDRMKKKMQKVLNQQSKADKRARLEKKEKEDLERLEREEELRLIGIDLRRKEREKRHQEQLEMERMEQEERKRDDQRRKEREMERARKSNGSKSRRSGSPRRSSYQSTKSDPKTDTLRSKSPNKKSSQGAADSKMHKLDLHSKRSRSKERRSRSSERRSKTSDSRSSGKVPKLVDY